MYHHYGIRPLNSYNKHGLLGLISTIVVHMEPLGYMRQAVKRCLLSP